MSNWKIAISQERYKQKYLYFVQNTFSKSFFYCICYYIFGYKNDYIISELNYSKCNLIYPCYLTTIKYIDHFIVTRFRVLSFLVYYSVYIISLLFTLLYSKEVLKFLKSWCLEIFTAISIWIIPEYISTKLTIL